jgi:hypothetical protein
MRKNCQRTINAWENGEPFGKRGDSIWTDGDGIYSYKTWILCGERGKECEHGFPFNATWYSQTTTTHQNAIRAYMDTKGYGLKVYDNVLRGTPYQF